MYKYNDTVRFKDARGKVNEGVIKECGQGYYFIEVDERILPDIAEDMTIPLKGFTLFLRKQRFFNWQAFVKPEWITGLVTKVEHA